MRGFLVTFTLTINYSKLDTYERHRPFAKTHSFSGSQALYLSLRVLLVVFKLNTIMEIVIISKIAFLFTSIALSIGYITSLVQIITGDKGGTINTFSLCLSWTIFYALTMFN